ncbi:MAG: ABC transporter permease subunit [Phycisphaerales bacterium]|nr:ABC transporter permease subunit [Phycisphaerales bacterium]
MIRRVTALIQRELVANFLSPIAYIVAALFLVATALFFMPLTLVEGGEASMRVTLDWMAMAVLVFTIPLLTMRTLADEFATGTIETLMTAPVADFEVVLGKFFGVLIFYLALLLTTVVHVFLLLKYGAQDVTVVLYSYLGMILLGGLYISMGIFASSLTRYQLLAAILTMGLLSLFGALVNEVAGWFTGLWRQVFNYVNIIHHFEDFSKGIFDTKAIAFFVSGTLFFLFLSVKVLESRRWR